MDNLSRSDLLVELKKSRIIIADYEMKLADKTSDKTQIENYLSGLLNNIPDMIFVLDEQGTYLDYKTGKTTNYFSRLISLLAKK